MKDIKDELEKGKRYHAASKEEKRMLEPKLYKEEITRIAFQAWGGELVLRVYLANDDNNFLVYFEPKPRLRYVEPNI